MNSRRKGNQRRRGNHGGATEPEYAVVDDQEEVLNVRMLPARPMYEDMPYADKDLPRSSSALSLSSLCSSGSNSSREIPPVTGPAVNRDLKPTRRKPTIDKRHRRVQAGEQHSHRRSSSSPPPPLPPPPPPPVDTVESVTPALTQPKPCRRARQQRAIKKPLISSHVTGQQKAEKVSNNNNNHRHSLDLETHTLEIRSQQNVERVPSERRHHEWPQTKGDFDQHNFVPKEKPQQTQFEDHWYVGTCSRADAEHALHLVNKDGAFLVRDCSANTESEPLVLSVYRERKVYNVKIRFLESTSKFALGTGQRSNDMFDSVADIIKFHTLFPIILISGRNAPGCKYQENCVLTSAVTRTDLEQLLQF